MISSLQDDFARYTGSSFREGLNIFFSYGTCLNGGRGMGLDPPPAREVDLLFKT